MKRIQKKIDDRYFETWLIILCNLLGHDEAHSDLADIRRQEEDDSLDGIDMSKPQKQHCEIEEELISLFHERYKRDKALTL